MNRSFAHRINNLKQILAGATSQAENLAKWFNADAVTEFQAQYDLVNQIQAKRNSLKARSQKETATMEEALKIAEGTAAFVKKVVRAKLPAETWPEFGFRKGEYAEKSGESEESTDEEKRVGT